MSVIVNVVGREILDSRGNPTVEVDVLLEDGARAAPRCPPEPRPAPTRRSSCATVTPAAIGGKGVRRAVEAVNGAICDALAGLPAPTRRDRPHDDRARRHREQGPARRQRDPRRQLAAAKAAAAELGTPLYRYVGGVSARVLPVPMMNIINGGAHADNPIDIQEFMIMPLGAERSPRRSASASRSSTR